MSRPLLLVLMLLGSTALAAEPSLAALSAQLDHAKAPKTRAQAAQRLGASGDPLAVAPLCKALSDGSDLVRSAASRALGELKRPEGADCIKTRLAKERGKGREALEKALASIEAATPTKQPVYVSLAPLRVQGDPLSPEALAAAEGLMRTRLQQLGATLAPAGESAEAASAVLRERGMNGYQLQVRLLWTAGKAGSPSGGSSDGGEPGASDGGEPDAGMPGGGEPSAVPGLAIRVLCTRYPDAVLRGQIGVEATDAELSELIEALAPRAMEDAAEAFFWKR